MINWKPKEMSEEEGHQNEMIEQHRNPVDQQIITGFGLSEIRYQNKCGRTR
jgi:hypothetical protein